MNKSKEHILLFILFFLAYSYFSHPLGGWNEASRFDLSYSIVNHKTISIDAYHKNTGDKSFYNGHYYSDKAPGLSFFAIPFLIILKTLTTIFKIQLIKDSPDYLPGIYLLTVICVSSLSAFLGLLFYRFAGYFTSRRIHQVLVAATYSLGTLAFPYSTLFISHQFSAVLIFAAFFLLFRQRLEAAAFNFKHLLYSGLLTGYAVISEFTVAGIAVGLVIYLYSLTRSLKNIFIFILGMLPSILVILAYNWFSTGSLFKLAYSNEANNVFLDMKTTFFGITFPKIEALYGITFGSFRGLFKTSPVLLLSCLSFYSFYKTRQFRKEFYLSLAIVLYFLVLNSSYYMWYGGWAMGPRHLIPSLPFLVFPAVFILEKYGKKKWFLSIFKILFLISVFFMLSGTATDPRTPIRPIPINLFIIGRALFGHYSLNLGMLILQPVRPILAFLHAPAFITLFPLILVLIIGFSKMLKTAEADSV